MAFLQAIIAAIIAFFSKPKPVEPPEPQPLPVTPSPMPEPTPQPASNTLLWDNPTNVQHSVRVICDEEGLTVKQKNELDATVHCESGYNPKCVHPNVKNGITFSTDYGICQVNDHYHIGPNKDFPSVDSVMNNPEACIRWMCRMWKANNAHLWVCYSGGWYKQFLKK